MANTSINTIYSASGLSGASGISGFQGVSGTSGTSGFSGTSGTSGFSGTSGASGSSGASGVSGASGAQGAAGPNGPSSTDAAYALKFVNEGRSNTTTLADDAELHFSVGSFEIWRFQFLLKMNSASAGPDYKLSINTDFSLGTGTFGALFTFYAQGGASLSSFVILSTLGADAIETFGAAPDNFVQAEGFIDTASASGEVYLQWAQNTSNATPVTMQSDSHVIAHRIFAVGPISAISAGNSHGTALTENGVVRTWGSATNGNLGNDTTTPNRSRPAAIVGEHVFDTLGSGNATIGIKSDGTAWGWGTNTFGNLGDNSTTNRSSPVSVVGGHSFVDVGGSAGVSSFLKSDGSAWGCGAGPNGDGISGGRSSPVSVLGGHSFIKISSGNSFYMGLKTDGSLWSWGQNSSGELGINAAGNATSPLSVVGNHSFIDVACGISSAYALKSDGSAWAWGSNSLGRLGDNSATDRSSPVSVVGGHSFSALPGKQATGANGIFIKSDGSVWTCGNGSNGALGNNSTTSRSSPVSVVGNHSFTSAGCGNVHMLALKADGQMWAWGLNSSGENGDRTVTQRSSPVLVG